MEISELLIYDIVANYSAYHIPVWQPKRIHHVISLISKDIADRLDYSDANNCIKSIAKEFDTNVIPYLIKSKFPVWVDLPEKETINPTNKNLVITYAEKVDHKNKLTLDRIENYAQKISADFIVLQGRTQGYLQLEKHRIKAFAEIYDRTLFISPDVYIRDNCPNIFEEVPEGFVGVCNDKKIQKLRTRFNKKVQLLKSEAYGRVEIMNVVVSRSVEDEALLMDSCYDDNVVLCDKNSAGIWSPFTFPFRFSTGENRDWMEILMYRNGYPVYEMPKEFNHSLYDDKINGESYVIRFEIISRDDNIQNTWIEENNIIGYKPKDPIDMSVFRILCLGHNQDQFDSIENREYIYKYDLNEIQEFEEFGEGKIYSVDFDSLFPHDKKFVGLTTASWKRKYVGLNPLDKMHEWPAIRLLNENTIICSDIFPADRFTREKNSVLREIYPKITKDQIDEFLELIGLEEYFGDMALSNQIIAKRNIVKSLFDFYKDNEILNKIDFFANKHDLQTRLQENANRRKAYLTEVVTLLWTASQNFTVMPQEILKNDWYR